MKLIHAMVRVTNLNLSLRFYCDILGFKLLDKQDFPEGRFTIVLLTADNTDLSGDWPQPCLELTHNWDKTYLYVAGENFGHIALSVPDIYIMCQKLLDNNIIINRPPRDGHMAFIKSPDDISIEFLQEGEPLSPKEPWISMKNIGTW